MTIFKRPVRIVMISHGYTPRIGGAERQLAALSPALQRLGFEVNVVTRHFPGSPAHEVIDGVHVHRIPTPGPKGIASLVFTFLALARIRSLKPDLIHAHELISPSTTALLAKWLFGVPIVTTVHGSGESSEVYRLRRRKFGKARLRLLCKTINAFIVISQKIDMELAEENVPPARRIRIPNGVDAEQFTPLPASAKQTRRADLGLPLDRPLAIYVGRFSPEKNVEHLVESWQAMTPRLGPAQLLLVGSGPLEEQLRAKAGDSIIFAGAQANVIPYLQSSDLFVLPSKAEGLSVALLEALACGLPVVATAVGGTPELIQDGETGRLVHVGDTNALQSAILALLQDENLRSIMGMKGREMILNQYALTTVARRLGDFYLDYLGMAAK